MDEGWKNVAMLEKLLDHIGPDVSAQDKVTCTMIHGNITAQHVVDAICHGVPGKRMNDDAWFVVSVCFSTKRFDRGVTRLLLEMLRTKPEKAEDALEMYLFAHVLIATNTVIAGVANPTVFNVYVHLMRTFESDNAQYHVLAEVVRTLIRNSRLPTVIVYSGVDQLFGHPTIAPVRDDVCRAFGDVLARHTRRDVSNIVLASRDSPVFRHPFFGARLRGGAVALEIDGYDRK